MSDEGYRFADNVPEDVREVLGHGNDWHADPRLIDTDREFGPLGDGRVYAVEVASGAYILLDRNWCGTLTLEAGPLVGVERSEVWRRAEDLLERFVGLASA